jgi:hypothetical protein
MEDFSRVVNNAKRRGVTQDQMRQVVDRVDKHSGGNEYVLTLLTLMAIDDLGPEEELALSPHNT